MSSDIWKIGQQTSAQNMYDDVKNNGFNGCRWLKNEVFAVTQLTISCAQMISAYQEVIDDQNSYLLDLENDNLTLEAYEADIQAKIEQLRAEITELEQKQEDGTITDEERDDLKSKKADLMSLSKSSESEVNNRSGEIKKKNDAATKGYKSKEAIAKDYGETTVEKGTPLAETKVSHGFFKKLFGNTGKNKKRVGENAVKIGNELLDKVTDSENIDKDIDTKFSRFKTSKS